EKRQAVISHAVTQGLNPNVPMKPSGIEWLGDVPAHWELKRLKYLGDAITGLTYSPADIVEDDTNGTLVLRSSNVQHGVITFDDNVYVSAAIPEELVTQIGDILICSRNGSRALIGKNATIDETSVGLTFGAFMTVFRSKHSAYLACVLNSPLFEFQSGAFMTSTINQLTIGVLNNFEVPFPPIDEQKAIVSFLAVESARFDTLTAEANRAIALLQERRTALISAAVTGQIDVRPRKVGAGETAWQSAEA
ncbi:MAG: restriction endonuclease subunit S, partial [Rugosibacter sp.]